MIYSSMIYYSTRYDIVYLVRACLARSNSQAQTRRGTYSFPCSIDHEQDWQPYPVDPYSAISNEHTYSHLSLCGVMGDRKRRA